MTPRSVEQVFLEPRGGVVQVLLVLEDEAGGRVRERLPLATRDLRQAVRQIARRLAQRGVAPATGLRLRVDRGGSLADDLELREHFLCVLEEGQQR